MLKSYKWMDWVWDWKSWNAPLQGVPHTLVDEFQQQKVEKEFTFQLQLNFSAFDERSLYKMFNKD